MRYPNALTGGRKLSYSEKLRDPRWQRKRLYVLERDCWRCRDCVRSDLQLDVHHCAYIRSMEPWDYPAELLLTLCHPCHEERQELEDNVRAAMGYIFQKLPKHRLKKVALRMFEEALEEMNT